MEARLKLICWTGLWTTKQEYPSNKNTRILERGGFNHRQVCCPKGGGYYRRSVMLGGGGWGGGFKSHPVIECYLFDNRAKSRDHYENQKPQEYGSLV